MFPVFMFITTTFKYFTLYELTFAQFISFWNLPGASRTRMREPGGNKECFCVLGVTFSPFRFSLRRRTCVRVLEQTRTIDLPF